MKISLLILGIIVLTSCSSSKTGYTTPKEEIISRIDELTKRPDWLQESHPFKIENGVVTSLGQATIPEDNRIEAAYRIAENNARSSIAFSIEQKLEFIFQNAEEGTSLDATQARFIGAEASKLTTNSLRLKNRYWEKINSVNGNGKSTITTKVFATIEMPEQDFKQAILEAIKKAQGKGGISKEFAEKVDKHWDKFAKE